MLLGTYYVSANSPISHAHYVITSLNNFGSIARSNRTFQLCVNHVELVDFIYECFMLKLTFLSARYV